MRINQNISAMNTYSRLTGANNAKSNSLARLSSGLRINKAGDDAAGLAISEKMRGQVGGLKQATRNAQDGISLIQTAEGALNETHSILQRMRELAVQSSTDTNTQDDRLEIQKEINQLSAEITRIGKDTQFNTQNLLDGSYSDKIFHIGANKGQSIEVSIEDMGADALKVNGSVLKAQNAGVDGLEVRSLTGEAINIVYKKNEEAAKAENPKIDAVSQTTATFDKESKTITVNLAQDAITWDAAANEGAGASKGGDVTANYDDIYAALETAASDAEVVFNTTSEFIGTTKASVTAPTDKNITAYDEDGTGNWKIDSEASKHAGINVSTQRFADEATSVIDSAIQLVSAERSKLGATQNRLDHTINNLTATAENLSAAESRIRDVDMAEEMMEFTKNNILSQAATAMLAQANQMPQSVLQLLQ